MTTTTTMIKQLKIFEIIIICILAKAMSGKSLNKKDNQFNNQENERVKRGFSQYGGNDFGSSVHVSSSVLQYDGGNEEHSVSLDSGSLSDISLGHSGSLDIDSHSEFAASAADPWAASGLSPGYDVWLEALPDYHSTSSLDSSTAISSTHPGSDQIANTVFSGDTAHVGHSELFNSQLHTQIGSSSAIDLGSTLHEHGNLAISDNIDFNNDADIKTQHYTKSYGK